MPRSRPHHLLLEDPFVKQEVARFASGFRLWRESKKLTRREVADSVGVSLQQISAIEKERTRPSFEMLVVLRKKMGLKSLSAA